MYDYYLLNQLHASSFDLYVFVWSKDILLKGEGEKVI